MKNFFNDTIEGQEAWPTERIGLYAPGNYQCLCHDCKGLYSGDKRSILCYPCAVASIKEKVENDKGAGI